MPQPTAGDVHLDSILTNIAVAYMQNAKNFVASRVFPIVPVGKQSDKYYIFDKNAWLRDQAQLRAPATESAGSGYTLSRDGYSADVFALHKDVDGQVRQNSDNPLNPDRNATEWLMQQMLLRQEIQFNGDFVKTGVWATDKTGGTDFTVWSDPTAGDPITNVEDGKDGILGKTGFEPNTFLLGYQVFRQLKHHPDIVDRIKYTSSQTVTADMLGAIFEIDRVLVSKAVKATNVEGATAAYSYTTGKSALLCYSAPAPGMEVASAGYIFMWQGISGGLGENVGIKKYRMEHLDADRIEAQAAWDNKVVATDLGYFYATAVA